MYFLTLTTENTVKKKKKLSIGKSQKSNICIEIVLHNDYQDLNVMINN